MGRQYMPGSVWNEERDAEFVRFVPGHGIYEIIDHMRDVFGVELTVYQVKNRKVTLGVKSGTNGGQFRKGNDGGFTSDEHRRKFLEAGKATRFKKGNMPHNGKPGLGHTRTEKDGYVMVKVREHREPGKPNTYEMRSRVVWEEHNGAIPDGCVIRHIDGDRSNDDIENLRCVGSDVNAWINNARRFSGVDANEHNFDTVEKVARLDMATKRKERCE